MALDNLITSSPLTLSENNLYANGRILVFADGSTKLVRDKVIYIPTEPDDYHIVKINDRITSIAYKFYNGKILLPQHCWWIIADVNPTLIRNPLDLSALKGKQLVIPNILNFKLKN